MFSIFSSIIRTTFILLLFMAFAHAKGLSQNDPKMAAVQLFESGNYTRALPVFKDLVSLYPDDPMLNYYYGASLIEADSITVAAKNALETASRGDVPVKIKYYQGIISQAEHEWGQAIQHYEVFASVTKRKIQKELNIDVLIDQCRNQNSPFKPIAEKVLVDTVKQTPTLKPDTVVLQVEKPLIIPPGLEDSIINFQINTNVKYLYLSHFRNNDSKRHFIEGWLKNQELKKLSRRTDSLRNLYQLASPSEKKEIADKILQAEQNVFLLNREIPEHYTSARSEENKYWDETTPEEADRFTREIAHLTDSIRQQKIAQQERLKKRIIEQAKPDTLIMQNPELIEAPNETTDSEISYRIQIGAYSGKLPDWVDRLFKKLAVIRKIENYTDDNGVTVYTTGHLVSYDEAVLMLKQVKQEGVKDAIVAAYKNGERIPLSEAKKYSKEQ